MEKDEILDMLSKLDNKGKEITGKLNLEKQPYAKFVYETGEKICFNFRTMKEFYKLGKLLVDKGWLMYEWQLNGDMDGSPEWVEEFFMKNSKKVEYLHPIGD